MADLRNAPAERDVEQAITALKKGAQLLKYGRRGKPKFCPFRLSNDETVLVWFSGKAEKQLKINQISKIIPGQRTAIFQRYPRPEKEYQSFSLMYSDRSLNLICKDKEEAEVWFVGLKALVSNGNGRNLRIDLKSNRPSSDAISPQSHSPLVPPFGNPDQFFNTNGIGKVFANGISCSTPGMVPSSDLMGHYSHPSVSDQFSNRSSNAEAFRVSLSSAISSSSHGSGQEDFDAIGDVFMWGEGVNQGFLGGGNVKFDDSAAVKANFYLPKALEPGVVLDVQSISCGTRHAVLVTKQGEVFSWGEESRGRLGHGVDADVSQPKLIDSLSGMNVEITSCGEYHSCAVTLSGELYTWGDGLLGHSDNTSRWIPTKVNGLLEDLRVSYISCGPWHTAIVTSSGRLFTFGEGTFGSLGHGDRGSVHAPREVGVLKGLRTVRVSCGPWHTAAIVETSNESLASGSSPCGKLFTWGDGDRNRLGHGDKKPRFFPEQVNSVTHLNFSQVACGDDMTIVLETSGGVYAMGSVAYGQLGSPEADGKLPSLVKGKLLNSFVEEVACGSHHVAVLTSRTEVYTWGRGGSGCLGHGDYSDRNSPTLVEALKDKQVKSIVCGSNFTVAICLHKWVSGADQSACSGCHLPFGFRRKRHNCYNCGLVFCKACSSRKSVKASLAPNVNKPYRVCDECFVKLKKSIETVSVSRFVKNLPEKARASAKSQRNLSRISSLESSKSSESRVSGFSANGSLQWGSFYSVKSSPNSIFGTSRKIFSISVPASRSTSPILRNPSPRTSSEAVHLMLPPDEMFERSKMNGDGSNQEAIKLKLRVEELTQKSEFLASELQKVTAQLQEATSLAREESAKCKAAKEVIKSLTAQLKNTVERVKENSDTSQYPLLPDLPPMSNGSISPQSSSQSPLLPGLPQSSNGAIDQPNVQSDCSELRNESTSSASGADLIEETEPGVFITSTPHPDGGKCLKRVRFSKKKFNAQQAERWWAENKLKIQDMYIIPAPDKLTPTP